MIPYLQLNTGWEAKIKSKKLVRNISKIRISSIENN